MIRTLKESIEHIDHDYQSAELLRAYMNVGSAYFVLMTTYLDESSRAQSKLYYEKARHLLAERVYSKLISPKDAYPQAVEISERLSKLGDVSSVQKSTATPALKKKNRK
jgi:hypothetical protein